MAEQCHIVEFLTPPGTQEMRVPSIYMLECFAALVAAAEREECAKVCEGFAGSHRASVFNTELARCAAGIRARGAK